MPLAINELVAATLHLQGEAAQTGDPDAEVQFDTPVTTSPLVIDETLAVAASQGSRKLVCSARRFGFLRRPAGNAFGYIFMRATPWRCGSSRADCVQANRTGACSLPYIFPGAGHAPALRLERPVSAKPRIHRREMAAAARRQMGDQGSL